MYDPYNLYRGEYKDFIENIMNERPLNEHFEYSEYHHVIPFCCEGIDNDEDNIRLYLTYREHFIAHKLLAEENPENTKLIAAHWFMCNYKKGIATPDEYAEARKKFIDSRIGVPLSEEVRLKMSRASLGKVMSLEARQKMRDSKLGKKRSEESIRKSVAGRKGYRHSEETKLKISTTEKGKIISDLTRDKISKSVRERDPEYKVRLSNSLKGNTNASGVRSEESILRMREAAKYKVYPNCVCRVCGKIFTGKSSRSSYCDEHRSNL